jgi:biotin operon repressor
MTVEERVQSLKEEGYDISFSMDEGNEFLEFATSDESSTSVRIFETEMITE